MTNDPSSSCSNDQCAFQLAQNFVETSLLSDEGFPVFPFVEQVGVDFS